MWKTCFAILVALMVAPHHAKAECNVCNTNNGVACTSTTTFQLCFNGVPQGSTWSCPNEGEVCTALGPICVNAESNSQIQPACGNTEQCGNCENVVDGAYSCTSHNTFAMCLSGEPTTVQGTCPSGQVCLTSRANGGVSPCVNQCLQDISDMCDLNSGSSATTTPEDTSSNPSSAATESSSSSSSVSASTVTASTASTATPSTASTATPSTASTATPSTANTATPSTASTATPSTASTATTRSVEDTECATKSLVGRYAYPNDIACTGYIYCYYSAAAGGLLGRAMACPTGRYFNSARSNCQVARPTGCV